MLGLRCRRRSGWWVMGSKRLASSHWVMAERSYVMPLVAWVGSRIKARVMGHLGTARCNARWQSSGHCTNRLSERMWLWWAPV